MVICRIGNSLFSLAWPYDDDVCVLESEDNKHNVYILNIGGSLLLSLTKTVLKVKLFMLTIVILNILIDLSVAIKAGIDSLPSGVKMFINSG
jgi:hypothetical protein